MKITYAWIDDPTVLGRLEVPQLCVEVDSEPDVTIEPKDFADGWSVGKYGPFVKYSWDGSIHTNPRKMNAGDFNVRFRNRFPVVVDIGLFVGEDDKTGIEGFSLPLTRARQLVRKWDRDWRLLVSERSAEKGNLLWLPVQTNPTCRHYFNDPQNGTGPCDKTPARIIRVGEVDLPLCAEHLKLHNDTQAAKRAAKAS